MTLNSVLQVLLSQRYHSNSSVSASLRSILRLVPAAVYYHTATQRSLVDLVVAVLLLTYVKKPIEPYHRKTTSSLHLDELIVLLTKAVINVVELKNIHPTPSANLSSTNSDIGFQHIESHNLHIHPYLPT